MHDDPFARAVQRAEAAEQAKQAAKRQERQTWWSNGVRTGFRVHATVFIAINLLLVAIWATTSSGYPWFIYPLLAWGAGLGAHYAAVKNHMGPPAPRPAPVQYEPLPPAPVPVAAPVAAGAPAPAPATPSAAAPPAAAERSTTEELMRLAELHKAGALSDAEFSAAKAKLLA